MLYENCASKKERENATLFGPFSLILHSMLHNIMKILMMMIAYHPMLVLIRVLESNKSMKSIAYYLCTNL